jgi:hypothetical protein
VARLNLTIPDQLYERLERLRDRVNVSKVCAVALAKELDMLETTSASGTDVKVQRLVQRLLRQRDDRERWYQRGRHDGETWAIELATPDELRMVSEEWNDESIADYEEMDDFIGDDFSTLNVTKRLAYWATSDRTDASQQAAEESDWRAYLQGWYHGVRDLWEAAKSALE